MRASCRLRQRIASRRVLPSCLFAFEVGACGWVDAALGDRDSVQGAVELAVAAAVEAVALVFAGAGVEGCDAGVAGELRVAERKRSIGPISQSSLAALNGPQPGELEQPWRERLGSCLEIPVEFERSSGSVSCSGRAGRGRSAPGSSARRRASWRLSRSSQTVRSSAPSGTAQVRVELVQVPAQPLLAATPLGDEVVAVIDQQLQLAQRLLAGAWAVQPRLLQRRPGDRERVDRVRLAPRPAAPALRRRQPRRHPHQPLALLNQRPLEAARHVPAILNRPQPLPAERASPRSARSSSDRSLRSPSCTAELVDRDRGQRVLVYVHPDHDHSTRLQTGRGDRRADRPQSRPNATLLSGHARRSREGGGDTTLASRQTSRHSGIESAAANPNSQTRTRQHELKMTLSSGMTPEQYEAAVRRARRTAYRFGDCNSLGRGVFRDEWDTAVTSLASIFSRGSVAR